MFSERFLFEKNNITQLTKNIVEDIIRYKILQQGEENI